MWTRRNLLRSGLALGAGLVLGRPGFAATDQLTLALSHEPPHLDPTVGSDPATEAVSFQNLFEGLIHIDRDGRVQPGLAKSWTTTPDGLSYTFALQTNVNFHDGTAFDAAHAVFSLDRLRGPGSQAPQKALYASIESVSAVDAATLRIVLNRKDGDLLFNLGRGDAAMVAPESADNNRAVPIGTGPFAFVQWDQSDDIVLTRNEDYWGPHPRLNQVNFVFMPDATAAVDAMLAGQLEAYPNFPVPEALAPLRGNANYQLVSGTGPDGKGRIGVWPSKLTGMWANAPLEGCFLADLRWADDTSPQQSGPAAQPSPDEEE
jgi:peptide/nickel transport system substrate-binding protein